MSPFNSSTQRLIVNHLSPENRYAVWQERLADVLKSSWNPEQKRFLEEVKNTLSTEIFAQGGASHQKFKNKTAKEWTAKATKLFTWEQLRMINTLSVLESSPKVAPQATHPTILKTFEKIGKENRQNTQKRVYGGDCNCEAGYWCSQKCYTYGCKSTGWGCGWFNFEPCYHQC
jgi:hypothetical protein